jgi:hypothetical protein
MVKLKQMMESKSVKSQSDDIVWLDLEEGLCQ